MRAPIRSQYMETMQGIYKKAEEMAHASAFLYLLKLRF